jgi:enoyl-[acyl-carrier protein] reductase II
LQNLLGTRRAKRGIFEGDLEQGELEIGQVSARIRKVQPAAEIVKELWAEYLAVKEKFCL